MSVNNRSLCKYTYLFLIFPKAALTVAMNLPPGRRSFTKCCRNRVAAWSVWFMVKGCHNPSCINAAARWRDLVILRKSYKITGLNIPNNIWVATTQSLFSVNVYTPFFWLGTFDGTFLPRRPQKSNPIQPTNRPRCKSLFPAAFRSWCRFIGASVLGSETWTWVWVFGFCAFF